MTASYTRATSQHMELFYKQYGAGPPLVILHGLLGAHGNWHTLSRKPFGQQYTIYTLDQRNHGRSPHSAVFDYDAMVADLEAFLDQQNLDEVYLLGHSMGGKTAMHFALEFPERVAKLIVVDIAPKAYKPRLEALFSALRRIDFSTVASRLDVDAALMPVVSDVGVRQFLLKNLERRSDGQWGWKINLEGIYQNYANINAGLDGGRVFEEPTLFIRGERSDYILDDDWAAITYLFPQAQLVTIPKAGHWVHAEAPDLFADAVLDFLRA